MHLEANTKEEAIRELIGIIHQTTPLQDLAEAERVVLEREKVMSTGMEHGVAIPHGKTDTVDRLLVAIALKPEGLDFQCMDGKPARILLVTLSPSNRSGPHLRFMAEVSRLLQDDNLRQNLLAAQTPETVVKLLTG
jgi:PTS system nitrogen regulatory IIA component